MAGFVVEPARLAERSHMLTCSSESGP
jgi:hypothetical protein